MAERPTYEDAKVCPRCKKPGSDRKSIKAPMSANLPRGTMIHLIYCETELCPWYNTCWQVQVNPDGSIPYPKDHRGEPKLYANIEGHDQLAAQIRDALELQRLKEIKPGNREVRNPNTNQ